MPKGWMVLAVVWAGCGGALEPGYTACGPVTCAPGQYCFGAGVCENGCTSDANCLPGEACVIDDDFFDDGQCGTGGGETSDASDPLAACEDACYRFQECGLDAADTAQCVDDCASLTEVEQEVVAECADDSCVGARDCLGVDCFDDDDCSGNQTCTGYVCL